MGKQEKRNRQLSVPFLYGAPDTIRTRDTKFRKLVLYPAELRAHECTKYYTIRTSAVSRIML